MKEKTNDTILGVFVVVIGVFVLYQVVFVFEKVPTNQFFRSPVFFPIMVAVLLIREASRMARSQTPLTIRRELKHCSYVVSRQLRKFGQHFRL